ncbi:MULTISPECIES: HEAT repeat domain-containing protein [Actinosynnema]|uniref:HEAT repeat domain-containing protein n=1 Tax=Actinosynnema TaxID=40566 RepID=UPI0020A5F54E|nr:HEAT repeat domain-containing protein [Actinosynnema pretiosum]MCP2097728.1 DNA-binding transcriptional regulator, MerR family [Actinosynnema pretiosum]
MLIGDVARHSGVSTRMLRHYDALGLVSPTGRTTGGYREYSADDLRRIFHVEGLRSLGLTLKQVRRALEDPAFTPSGLVGDLIEEAEARAARARELLDRLRVIETSAPDSWRDVLRVVELVRGLDSPTPARRQQAVLSRAEVADAPAELLANALLAEADPNVAGALHWALAHSGGDGVPTLAAGARSADPEVRRRAVRAIGELPDVPGTTALLADALADPDPQVGVQAALTLGARGAPEAVPHLVRAVVAGHNDVDAAEALGALSEDPAQAERITGELVDWLATADPAARIRLTQALVELSGPAARAALRALTADADPAVALVASALVAARGEGRG